MKIYNLSNKELFINQHTILRKSWWCWDVFLCWLWFCCHLLDIWIGKSDFWNSLIRFIISIFRWWNALTVHYAVIMKNFIVCDSLEVSSFSMLYSNVVIAIRRTKKPPRTSSQNILIYLKRMFYFFTSHKKTRILLLQSTHNEVDYQWLLTLLKHFD